jgi:hypothetical protein
MADNEGQRLQLCRAHSSAFGYYSYSSINKIYNVIIQIRTARVTFDLISFSEKMPVEVVDLPSLACQGI